VDPADSPGWRPSEIGYGRIVQTNPQPHEQRIVVDP
jgi:hypothetical protein